MINTRLIGLGMALCAPLNCGDVLGAREQLIVAISVDIPPYVINHATRGLEIDLMRAALPEYDLEFKQMDYGRIQSAINGDDADVAVGVHLAGDGAFYSHDVLSFVNYAYTRRQDQLTLKGIDDLAGHPVLTWDGADLELGDEIERLYGPGGAHRDEYMEFDDQADQVRTFWAEPDRVCVIDASIFEYFTRRQGKSLEDAVAHDILPPVTNLKIAFRDESLRDQFDDRLGELCRSGKYAAILKSNGVHTLSDICERESIRDAMEAYTEAARAMFRGDIAPMEAMWSHADDVYYMGPAGDVRIGWNDVRQSWQAQADMKLGGNIHVSDVHVFVGPRLAFATSVTHGSNRIDDEMRSTSIRNTVLFRKEGGVWKVIGAHADRIAGIR